MSGGPKLSLLQHLSPLDGGVWVEAHVFRAYDDKEADSFKRFMRYVCQRGPDATARVSTCANRLVDAIRKKGPEVTYEDLISLAEAWERGELDVH